MAGKLLIDAHYSDETRVAIIDENENLVNFETEYSDRRPIKGNIYLAKVVRIEPAIQAAFIDYGGDKHGFLSLSEIHYDYFNKNVMKSLDSKVPEDVENDEAFKAALKRNLKIQEVISTKQILLVQAEKEVRGNKCAFFTTFISIPGRYCVLMPNPPQGKTNGISKKIESSEKERLREIIGGLDVPEGMSCIIRTAGEKRTKQEIKRDLEYLCRLWNEIRAKVTSSIAPTLIHEEGNITKRVIRDLYQRTMDKIIIQGKDSYKEARAFMKTFTPSHVKKIELYDDHEMPIFHKYKVEDKIDKILDPTVKLPSGGSIVINTTEALTAIDVNSGKSKNERDIEETALKTNLEAATEIARQIKLRDIAGIIVIDFIDMISRKDHAKVEKKMREVMKDDYSSLQFSHLSQFGLMEISRQRIRTSLADATFVQCSHCGGSGKVLANETVALSIIRKIEKFLVEKNAKSVVVELHPGIDLFILNHKRKLISEMESSYDVFIEITRNPAVTQTNCKFIVKEYKPKPQVQNKDKSEKLIEQKVKEASSKTEDLADEKIVNKTNVNASKIKDSESSAEVSEKPKNRKRRRGGFKKAEKLDDLSKEIPSSESEPAVEQETTATSEKPKKQRRKKGAFNKSEKLIAPKEEPGVFESEVKVENPETQSEVSEKQKPQRKRRNSFKNTRKSEKIANSQEESDSSKIDSKEEPKVENKKPKAKLRKNPAPKNPEPQKEEKVAEKEVVHHPEVEPVMEKVAAPKRKSGWLKKIFS